MGADVEVAGGAIAVLNGVACAAAFGIASSARRDALRHVAAAGFALAPILLFPLFSMYFYSTLAVDLCALATFTAVRACQASAP